MPPDSKTSSNTTPEHYPASSSTQRVFLELRDRIILGDIAPGERLKVESLKASLKVGATPIREALSLLTSDQLVERIDQRGFRAAAASEKNFQEILTLRCQLEAIALTDSIKRGDNTWEEQLVLCHHRLTQADARLSEQTHAETTHAEQQQLKQVQLANTDGAADCEIASDVRTLRRERERLHKAFHIKLLQACDSPVLLKFCNQLYDLNIRYRFLAGESVQYASRDVGAEHTVILNATIERNATAAVDALLDHYRQTGVFLADQLDASGASTRSNSTSE